ncbi:MAG TPA: hypothetical protein VFD89_08695 [Clostridia bacterium]|nr:hypothetical protein [Clostridia bacterium]
MARKMLGWFIGLQPSIYLCYIGIRAHGQWAHNINLFMPVQQVLPIGIYGQAAPAAKSNAMKLHIPMTITTPMD